MNKRHYPVIASAILTLSFAGAAGASDLYTLSNDPAANAVLRFEQQQDGSLDLVESFQTGGLGTGGGLGNQGAITADDDFLYAVDAGSDEISVFRFDGADLVLVDNESSGGTRPVSLTIDRGVLYVVNAGSDNIAGFRVGSDGRLAPIPGSGQGLSQSGTGPAQISFSKDGRNLIVTEKATQRILTFPVDRNGTAGPAQVFDSPGATPFGFAVTSGRRVLVSEAAGGAPNASSVTSWKLSPKGELSIIDPVAATQQSAACWVIVTPNGRFAYTTNTASGSISAFRVRAGELLLQDADGVAATTGPGSAPIDMAVTPDGRYLHVLSSGSDEIVSFAIANNGSLASLAVNDNLPDGANGLLAR